ncbi:aldo/keto reductase family domain-containing protein [Ditylenchus destructor]|nr:aldo/keto reductase family domain-containing protein [Ditylenchus destructor]
MYFLLIFAATFAVQFTLAPAAEDGPIDPKTVPTIRLSNGVEMPVIGLGTALSYPGQVEFAVDAAITAGYRLIDTAHNYDNEEAIGNALQYLISSGVIKREDIFVSTKLTETGYHKEDVESQLREQLGRLKLDYVDMYLMHFPAAFTGMEDVYNKNLTRSIGVSNFNTSQLERVMKVAKVPIHNLQVECHVHFVQRELQELCRKNNISMTCYAPLGAPGRPKRLLPKGSPYPWPPGPKPLLNPEVLKLSGKYGKPPASILLRYLIQRGNVAIPKSVQPERIHENIQVFDFNLTDDEMDKLSQSQPQKRLYTQDWLIGHPEDPFASERQF